MFSTKHKSSKVVATICNIDNPDKITPVYIHERASGSIPEDYFLDMKLNREEDVFKIFPEHQESQTDRIILTAPPGAGKTSLVKEYLSYFNELNPNSRKAVLFTKQTDEDFDQILLSERDKVVTIPIDDTILNDPITIGDLANRQYEDGKRKYINQLVIFDDYQQGKQKINDEISRIRNDLADNGRKLNLYVIVAQSDLPVNKQQFRNFLSNTTHFIYFALRKPCNLTPILKNYYGIDTQMRNFIESSTKSRWICVVKNDIPYILSDDFITINDQTHILDQIAAITAEKKKYQKKQPTLESIIVKAKPKLTQQMKVNFDKEHSISIDDLDKMKLTEKLVRDMKYLESLDEETLQRAATEVNTKVNTKVNTPKDYPGREDVVEEANKTIRISTNPFEDNTEIESTTTISSC